MQGVGAYTFVTTLGVCEVGSVWAAFDAGGRRYTVAMLDSAPAGDSSWRAAFSSAAQELSGTPGGLPVVEADYDAENPWVACADEPGPGAAQIFLALGLQYQMILVNSGEFPQVEQDEDAPVDAGRPDATAAPAEADRTATGDTPGYWPPAAPGPDTGGGSTGTGTPGAGWGAETSPTVSTPAWASGSGGYGSDPDDRADRWGGTGRHGAPEPDRYAPAAVAGDRYPAQEPPAPYVPPSAAPVSSTPMSGAPMSGTPMSSTPMSSTPASSVPAEDRWSGPAVASGDPGHVGPAPVSGGPLSPHPVSGMPGLPVSGMPNSQVSAPGFGAPGGRFAASPYPARHDGGRRRTRMILLVAVVAVLSLAAGTTVGALVVGKPAGTRAGAQQEPAGDVDLGLPTARPSQPGLEPPKGGGWPTSWPTFRSTEPTRTMSNLDGLGFSFQVPPDWQCTKTAGGTGYAKYNCGVGTEIGGEVIVRQCRKLCTADRRDELRGYEEAWGLPWIKSGPFATWLETNRIDGADRYGLAYVAYWRSVPEDAIDRQLVLRMTAPPGRANEVRKVANSIRDVTFTL
jgi:hypothetical protein